MAHPKRRHSNTRTRLRRSQDRLELPTLSTCANCGRFIKPHHVCTHCGHYRGRQIVTIAAKTKEGPGKAS